MNKNFSPQVYALAKTQSRKEIIIIKNFAPWRLSERKIINSLRRCEKQIKYEV